jgi:arginyl-tRNA synthetase
MSLFTSLNKAIHDIITSYIGSKGYDGTVPERVIGPSRVGDYQITGTKKLSSAINDIDEFMDYLYANLKEGYIEKVELVKGKKKNYNINVHLNPLHQLENLYPTFKLGVENKKVLVDYPSPNTAKILHIGHIRAIVIGDVIANYMEHVGHDVSRVSHNGDYGTQFGILIHYVQTQLDGKLGDYTMDEVTSYYSNGKKLYDADPSFKEGSQQALIHIQNKSDSEVVAIWEDICKKSLDYCFGMFAKMGASDKIESVGESFYHQFWPTVKAEMELKGVLEDSDGATVTFVEGYADPLMVEKSNKCITYDTTDIIAVWYRLQILKMDHIIYLTDDGQSSHFKKLFKLADKMGWVEDGAKLQHFPFGKVRKPDGMAIKTRDASTIIALEDVIQSVIDESKIACEEKGRTTDIADLMAINSMRYFELAHAYKQSYNFDLKRMVTFNGDSALYTMYTYARFKKITTTSETKVDDDILSSEYKFNEHETKLLKTLSTIDMLNDKVYSTIELNKLTRFMFDLCNQLNSFYASTRVLGSDGESIKVSLISKALGLIEEVCSIIGIKLFDEI